PACECRERRHHDAKRSVGSCARMHGGPPGEEEVVEPGREHADRRGGATSPKCRPLTGLAWGTIRATPASPLSPPPRDGGALNLLPVAPETPGRRCRDYPHATRTG